MRIALLAILFFQPLLAWSQAIQVHSPEEINYNIQPRFGDLDAIAERGILRILVTHSNTDFFFDHGRIRGIQYEMALEFLKHINEGRTNRYHASEANRIFPQFIPVTFAELLPALQSGHGDIAAALLTVTPEREQEVDIVSPNGREVSEIVVSHMNAAPINRTADLSGKSVYVLRSSSYQRHLEILNEKLRIAELPPVEII